MRLLRIHPLALIAALLIVVGCAQGLLRQVEQPADELSALVSQHVADPLRAEQAHTLIAQLGDAFDGFYRQHVDISADFFDLNANYYARPQEFEELLDRAQAGRAMLYDRITVLAFQARTAVTPEEWETIHEAMLAERGW